MKITRREMLKASAATFYTPFGGVRVPTPMQYWTGVMQSLQSSSRSAPKPNSSSSR